MLDFGNVSSSGILLIGISTIAVLLIGALVAAYFSKKNQNSDDWAIGGRTVPLYVLVFSMFSTQIGGAVLVGHVGIGYSYGFAPMAYAFCGVTGLLLMALIASWLRKNEFVTIPDIFRKVYGEDKALLLVGSLMSMVVPMGWVASQITAFGKLYSSITGLDTTLLVIIFAIICMLFTLPAGFNSVVWSDFIFGIIMVALCFITAFQAIDLGGGMTTIIASFPDQEKVSFPSGLLGAGVPLTLMWLVGATPGVMTNQMSIQRVCAADTAKNARKILIISAIMIIVMEVWVVIIALATQALNPTLASGEDAIGFFLTQIPTWTVALFAGFITTTIITTTDSAIQSVAVNLTYDIYRPYINPKASDAQVIRFSKFSTVGITIFGIAIALLFPEVLNLIVMSYSYAASALLIPIYAGCVISKHFKMNRYCGLASMIGGFIGCFIASNMGTYLPAALYGILTSAICFAIALFATKCEKITVTK